jgi:hypothetical protein
MESDSKTPVFNDSAIAKTQKDAIPGDAIPFDRAMQIFDQLADRTDIAFGYAEDGCYARAQLMCLIVNAMGLPTPKKAWAFEGAASLKVKKPDRETISWWYHVTAALPVKMPDGPVQDMVFDPGLFDGPVSLSEWGGIMGAKPSQLQIAPFGEPPKGYSGDYMPNGSTKPLPEAYKEAVGTMSSYLKWQSAGPRTVFQSQSRQQFCQMQGYSINHPQGKTWQSAAIATGSGLKDRALNMFSFSNG